MMCPFARFRVLAVVFSLLGLSGPSWSATIFVTTTSQLIDAGSCTAAANDIEIADLPGTDGLVSLAEAICAANGTAGNDTIELELATYAFCTAHNYWYGPNALPVISSEIEIEGNGATLVRGTDGAGACPTPDPFRFFYIAGSLHPIDEEPKRGFAAPKPGTLTLRDLTVVGGLARGGLGGGSGMGGAIYNQGSLTLDRVSAEEHEARGGAGSSRAGGGMFGPGSGFPFIGGGFGPGSVFLGPEAGTGPSSATGGTSAFGGNGGSGADGASGGGGGFAPGDDGTDGNAVGLTAGVGGDGGGDGDTAGTDPDAPGGGGGAFGGGGGNGLLGKAGGPGGGGGVGGGGGFGEPGGAGGFGGGGGSSFFGGGGAGPGGFGGGGGGAYSNPDAAGGAGGFGGGGGVMCSDDNPSHFGGSGGAFAGDGVVKGGSCTPRGGGGAGLGGFLFNHFGSASITNSTMVFNLAVGGAGADSSGGGAGLGGAIFNLNGTVTLENSTLSENEAQGGAAGTGAFAGQGAGGAVFHHFQTDGVGNTVVPVMTTGALTVLTIEDSILANSVADPSSPPDPNTFNGTNDCFNSGATVTLQGGNLIESNATGANACGAPTLSADPLLGSYELWGGLTPSLRPSAGSPVIDATTSATCTPPAEDQRGRSRPIGAECDLGSHEVDPADVIFEDGFESGDTQNWS